MYYNEIFTESFRFGIEILWWLEDTADGRVLESLIFINIIINCKILFCEIGDRERKYSIAAMRKV